MARLPMGNRRKAMLCNCWYKSDDRVVVYVSSDMSCNAWRKVSGSVAGRVDRSPLMPLAVVAGKSSGIDLILG
jgi:hypothetical protein